MLVCFYCWQLFLARKVMCIGTVLNSYVCALINISAHTLCLITVKLVIVFNLLEYIVPSLSWKAWKSNSTSLPVTFDFFSYADAAVSCNTTGEFSDWLYAILRVMSSTALSTELLLHILMILGSGWLFMRNWYYIININYIFYASVGIGVL